MTPSAREVAMKIFDALVSADIVQPELRRIGVKVIAATLPPEPVTREWLKRKLDAFDAAGVEEPAVMGAGVIPPEPAAVPEGWKPELSVRQLQYALNCLGIDSKMGMPDYQLAAMIMSRGGDAAPKPRGEGK